jgi:hypothetical protein
MFYRLNPGAAILSAATAAAILVVALAAPAQAQGLPTTTAGFVPGATLTDDLKDLKVTLVDGYAKGRPRLLYGPGDREALAAKAKAAPELWSRVLASAKRLGATPAAEDIRSGKGYWRIERVQSGALAWFVTGQRDYLDAASRWMVAHCQEPVWGNAFRPNMDLEASWYLYHIAIAYDTLHDGLSDGDRRVIREGLSSHAKVLYESLAPEAWKDGFRYDQNHTYIPAVALAAGALALLDEEPAAADWLKRAYAVMRRCRYVMGEDGYYYEGTGYWSYALHWHVRYADLIERATGRKAHDLPILRENWRMGLQLGLPGSPYWYDIGDVGKGAGDGNRLPLAVNQHGLFWDLAAKLKSSQSRLVGDLLDARWPEQDYPASALLWFDPSIAPAKLQDIPPYQHFADHDLVAWRSGWDANATCYLFRCGPPLGHAAAAKLKQLTDWMPNCGHVHPDIGAFWMYGGGAYLATGTGYTANKFTRDHNTITIDDVGQAKDGEYHNERGYPYERLDRCRIDRVFRGAKYGFASGEFGPAYPAEKVGEVSLRRSVLMTAAWMLVVDEFHAPAPHKLSWYCHADAEFRKEGGAFVARLPKAALAVVPVEGGVSHTLMEDHPEKTEVMAGTAPDQGKLEVRGWQLRRVMKDADKNARLVHFLVPLEAKGGAPTGFVLDAGQQPVNGLAVGLRWPDERQESVVLDLAWKASTESGGAAKDDVGPAQIK